MKKIIKGVKGFDKDLKCRGFQYEIGNTYETKDKPKTCNNGFHFCEEPLNVFNYYSPTDGIGNLNRFCLVEALGDISKDGEDSKVATNKIKIGAELTFKSLTEMAVSFVYEHVKKDNKPSAHKEESRSVASNTGYSSVASNTGYSSVASNTGDSSVASNTGYRSVASNTGDRGISSSLGIESKAKGALNTWLVLAEWKYVEDNGWEVVQVKTIKVDDKKIKSNTMYQLISGKFVEVEDDNN